MKYFIDGGACDGRSVKSFRAWKERSEEYKVFSFEPNPQFHEELSNMEGVDLRKEAIWVKNGTTKLFLGTRQSGPAASSLYGSKGNVDRGNFVEVPCIDFSSWLKQYFFERDEIVLKLDIECAEFPVLSKMIDDGSLDLVSELCIEFHHRRYPSLVDREEHTKVLEYIRLSSLPLYYWAGGESVPARPYPESSLAWKG